MGLTDDIRKFVYENYIRPAKSRGRKEVTVRAGDVHKTMRLSSQMPTVCSALKSKMENVCNVEVVSIKTPQSGTGANFYITFRILPEGKTVKMPSPTILKSKSDVDALSEDEIKKVLETHLISKGWIVKIAWGHTRGADIDAKRGSECWVIEVKGPGSRPPMRVNYFISILGETLQRMNSPNSKYSIALPDLQQFRRLWERLPSLAKKRTRITALFVNTDGHIDEVS